MAISKLSTLVLLTLTLPSQAFIPSNHKKQLTIGTGMPVQGSAPTSPLHFAGTNTALQANLFDRFFRVANANLNKLVNSLEDPEKVIAQTVQEMQSDLIRIRQAYSTAVASQRRLDRQREQAEVTAQDWKKRATLALRRGEEGLAREALARRQAFVDKANTIQQQLKTQQIATDKLYSAMMELEGKIQEAGAKKEQLVARARTAKTTQKVNDMLSGLTGKTSMDAFNRMEEKVEALESAAEVSMEMTNAIPDTIEADFRRLEQSSKVDDELLKLKQDLKLLSPSSSTLNIPSIRERASIPAGRGKSIHVY